MRIPAWMVAACLLVFGMLALATLPAQANCGCGHAACQCRVATGCAGQPLRTLGRGAVFVATRPAVWAGRAVARANCRQAERRAQRAHGCAGG